MLLKNTALNKAGRINYGKVQNDYFKVKEVIIFLMCLGVEIKTFNMNCQPKLKLEITAEIVKLFPQSNSTKINRRSCL